MKRMKWVVAAVALFLVGCGGLTLSRFLPPGTIKTPAGDPILHTFESTTITSTSTSQSANCPGSITVSGTAYACTLELRTFSSDGSWTSTNPESAASGTYGYSSDKTQLTIINNGVSQTGTITWGTGNNYFDWNVNGIVTRWVKQ